MSSGRPYERQGHDNAVSPQSPLHDNFADAGLACAGYDNGRFGFINKGLGTGSNHRGTTTFRDRSQVATLE